MLLNFVSMEESVLNGALIVTWIKSVQAYAT